MKQWSNIVNVAKQPRRVKRGSRSKTNEGSAELRSEVWKGFGTEDNDLDGRNSVV
ncbi:MAG: hypothetical protein ACTS4T_01215 [Candidatus Hodgkinia cicadicola]